MKHSWSSGTDFHVDWRSETGRPGLAEAVRSAIRGGRVRHGDPMPSTRALARDLGVARGTVTRVYADLTAEGYLHSSQGAPTTVAYHLAEADPAPRSPHRMNPAPRWSLQPGIPDLSAFPRHRWLASTRTVLQNVAAAELAYPDERGAAPLREALARYLVRARGVRADPERIIVCGGFSHAMSALTRTLGELGHRDVDFEDPSFWYYREIAAAGGLTPHPVGVDEHGVRVSEMDSSVAVVTPSHQYPLGHTLAPARRVELAGSGRWVIEDDYDGEFRFDRTPVGAMQALAPERIIYAGTVSKTLAPGLRIGWLVLPRGLVGPVRETLTATGWRGPVLDQLVLADFLNSGAYDTHVRRQRSAYRSRRDRLLAALPETLRPQGISAGLHLPLLLPAAGPTNADITAAAARHSLRLETLEPFWMTASPPARGLVVGYAAPAEHAVTPTFAALLAVLADLGFR